MKQSIENQALLKLNLTFNEISQTDFSGKDLFQLAEASYPHGSPWSVATFSKDLKQPFVNYFTVSNQLGLVGFIGYRQVFDEVEITNLVVASNLKKQGLGDYLIKAWLTLLVKAKARVIHLEVRKNNLAAVALYRKNGFKLVNIRKDYYDYPVEDALIMNLELEMTVRESEEDGNE